MKQLAALQQNRRSNSFRCLTPPDNAATDGGVKSPATVFWVLLHGFCCIISLVLGFRFSRLVFFLLFSSTTTDIYTATNMAMPSSNVSASAGGVGGVGGGSRVVVGRHGILIRPWPHPDPVEVMKAHNIIERVQREQRAQYGVKNPRTVIVITPTYVRTFQTLHLTGVMHSLMNVPYDLVWIVIEAGGTTNETSELIAKSGLRILHVGFNAKMPVLWEDRHELESKMRLQALRIVRENRLDGVVMFVDDSNMHSMELFDEIQNVKWVGAVPIGILAHSEGSVGGDLSAADGGDEKIMEMPVQGPACNASNHLVGWRTFDTRLFVEQSAKVVGDRAVVLPKKMEWSGFVLNSRLVWKDADDKPRWMKDLDEVVKDMETVDSPLYLLTDASVVEPLGNCGHKVMLWWLRVEARADSKFPSRWIIDPPLDITVPAKRTPWPDAPPELPSLGEKTKTVQENTEKRAAKPKSTKRRSSRSKRKRTSKVVDEHVFTRRSGDA